MLLGLLTLLLADVAPDSWTGFRNEGTGASRASNLPVAWTAKDLAWKMRLPGYGQSTPVVWNGRVFVTAVAGENHDTCMVLAFDAESGRSLWSHKFPAGHKTKSGQFVSRAAPTALVDAARLYVFFETGDLLALSHAGQLVWQRSLAKEHGAFDANHGVASSLAGSDDAVYVQVDHKGPSYLLAVRKRDGHDLWKTARPSGSSWASPVAVRRGGHTLVLTNGGGRLQAYDAASGAGVWAEDGLSGSNFGSPALAGNLVLIGAADSKTATDLEVVARSNCCIRLVVSNGKAGREVVWRAAKVLSSMATPLAYRDCAYFVSKTGIVTCVSLASGAVHYRERLDEPCWASPLAAGAHIYFFGKNGTTTVLRAGPHFEELATNTLAEIPVDDKARAGEMYATDDTVYGAAAVERTLFIRSGTMLFCVRSGQSK